MLNGRADGRLIASSASAEEAAAIVAALERFMRATAAADAPPRPESLDGWRRVAALEAVQREVEDDPGNPWINT